MRYSKTGDNAAQGSAVPGQESSFVGKTKTSIWLLSELFRLHAAGAFDRLSEAKEPVLTGVQPNFL